MMCSYLLCSMQVLKRCKTIRKATQIKFFFPVYRAYSIGSLRTHAERWANPALLPDRIPWCVLSALQEPLIGDLYANVPSRRLRPADRCARGMHRGHRADGSGPICITLRPLDNPRWVDARKEMGKQDPVALVTHLLFAIFRGTLSVYLGWASALRILHYVY